MARVILIMMLAALPLRAQDAATPSGTPCYCTDNTGARVELGQYICLHINGRSVIMQCQMSLNVPMWREIHEGCLSSRLEE